MHRRKIEVSKEIENEANKKVERVLEELHQLEGQDKDLTAQLDSTIEKIMNEEVTNHEHP